MKKYKLKDLKLTYRKLKISDYYEFKKLFYNCFSKQISFKFFKWRYFNDKSSFCYGVFKKSRLIANVGMIALKLNNTNREIVFSRHSSMVLKDYRGIKVFSNLLKLVKKKTSQNVKKFIMWPNKNNFSNFGIEKKKVIGNKYYLYETSSSLKRIKKTKNYRIDQLTKYQNFISSKDSFFYKDLNYFKKRYLSYKKNEYLLNKFESEGLFSFFILKYQKNKKDFRHIILEHFGSKKIRFKHLSSLINDNNKLIFLSKKKINKPNFQILNYLNFKIGFLKKYDLNDKIFVKNKDIFLGDTDIFITL